MSLSLLPSVTKKRIASYLDHCSALRFSNSSKDIHTDVSLSLLSPRYELIYSQIVHGESVSGDSPIKSSQIPIFGDNPHTVILSCRWKDQGWGERKGKLFVVAHSLDLEEENEESTFQTYEDEFRSGCVVFESPIVSHSFQHLNIAFSPQPNAKYHLWYLVGGGGGHLLIVEDLCVEILVFDDVQKSMKDAYASLCDNGVIRGEDDSNADLIFYTKLLLAVIRTYSQKCKNKILFDSFNDIFRRQNLGVLSSPMLQSLHSVCSSFLQFLNMCNDDSGEQFETNKETINWEEPINLAPFMIFSYSSWEKKAGDFKPVKCALIPFMRGRTQSIRLTCTCEVNEYDTSGGKLYIVAERDQVDLRDDSDDTQTSFLVGKRLVWESTALHQESTSLEISFVPEEYESYFLYHYAGDSDDSVLSVTSLFVHLTVFDDEFRSLELCYDELLVKGALDSRQGSWQSFQLNLLLAAISFVQNTNGLLLYSEIHEFFRTNRFGIQSESMRSLKELTKSILLFKEQEMTKPIAKIERDLRMFSCL